MALLGKIGSLHNHLSIELAILKDQKDCIHDAIFDDAKELSEIDEMEIKQLETKQKIDIINSQLIKAYSLYDQHGHFKDLNSKILDRKLALRPIPAICDHVCGGITGGQAPRMCTATNCKMNCHVKTRFGLKYEKALYQVLNGNLVHPIPVCRKEQ